jgi:hypothetical protein
MKIKFKLETEKAAKATVAITASYRLGLVFKGTEYPQLAFANAIALIAIIRNPVFGNRNHNYYSTVMNYWSVTIKVIR